jgi:imidazolonepropionase-like amidohydrolase
MIRIKLILLFFLPLSFSLGGQANGILIKNGTVLTVTNGVIESGDVLLKDGKIAAIGEFVPEEEGMRIIDARGKFIMPGIVDAHSHLAIDVVNEATSPVTAEVNVGDVIDPYDIGIYRALAGGVTVSHAMHGSANAIGGQCETIKHRYGEMNPEALKMEGAPRTIKFALGENPMRVHGEGKNVVPATRMGIEAIFRKAFLDAVQYKEKKSAYERGLTDLPPPYSERLETLEDILDGKIIIQCHSYRADEILMLMDICREFGVEKLVFQHVNEGYKVAPELAEFGAGASIFSDWWAYKFEVYYSTAYNAAILTKNGVVTSINSDSRELIRHLYHEAAKSQKYGGLTDEEALALITINPAKHLGIDNRVGSLEVGKDADLVIFNAHPLSIYAIPETTFVDGIERFSRYKDPDDMRLIVNPETPAIVGDEEEDKGCLFGTGMESDH